MCVVICDINKEDKNNILKINCQEPMRSPQNWGLITPCLLAPLQARVLLALSVESVCDTAAKEKECTANIKGKQWGYDAFAVLICQDCLHTAIGIRLS